MINRKREIILAVVLAAAILFQLSVGWPRILYDANTSWVTFGKNNIWRSANIYRSEKFAGFIEFLNASIPTEGKVGLPPKNFNPEVVSIKPTMQFFLQNRDLETCSDTYVQCVQGYLQNGYSAVIINGIPGQIKESLADESQIIMYDGKWGVINPQPASEVTGNPLLEYPNRVGILKDLPLPFLLVGVFLFLGFWMINYFYPQGSLVIKFALSFGFFIGLFTIVLCLFMITTGGALTTWLIIASLVLMVAAAFVCFSRGRSDNSHSKIEIDAWLIVLVLYLAFQLYISFGRAYSSSDDVYIWGVKGYAIAYRGLFEALRDWGTQTTKYTLNIPIMIGVFKKLFTEALPESKIIFPMFAFSLWLLIYDFLKRRLPRNIAGLSTLLVATVPLIYRHANKAYANLPVSYYFVAAVLLVIYALEETNQGARNKLLFLSSVFFILAAWTRPESVVIAAVIILYICVFWGKTLSKGNSRTFFYSFILPYVLFLVFWVITSHWVYSGYVKDQGMYQAFIQQLIKGNLYFSKIGMIFSKFAYYLYNTSNWGSLGFVLSLAMLIFITNKGIYNKLSYLGIAILYILMVFGVYYSTLFVDGPSLAWWLSTGLTRLVMPGLITLWVLMAYYEFPVLINESEQ